MVIIANKPVETRIVFSAVFDAQHAAALAYSQGWHIHRRGGMSCDCSPQQLDGWNARKKMMASGGVQIVRFVGEVSA